MTCLRAFIISLAILAALNVIVVSGAKEFNSKQTCAICSLILKSAKDFYAQNKSEVEIIGFVKQNLCFHMGNIQQECTKYIEENSQLILNEFDHETNPEVTCRRFGVCNTLPATPRLGSVLSSQLSKRVCSLVNMCKKPTRSSSIQEDPEPICKACEFFLSTIGVEPKSSHSKEEIIRSLLTACALAPNFFRKECLTLVKSHDTHFIELFSDLVTYIKKINHRKNMEFCIFKTWDNQDIDHPAVRVTLEKAKPCCQGQQNEEELLIKIDAPFFNDPPKPESKEPGDVFKLWEYEVVEVYFASESNKYIELEFGPYGHYLALLFHGYQNNTKIGLPIDYKTTINGNSWKGVARIPESYFPASVTKWNAYAIHYSDPDREYEALYPVEFGKYAKPDFHRLEYFSDIAFGDLLSSNCKRTSESSIWNS